MASLDEFNGVASLSGVGQSVFSRLHRFEEQHFIDRVPDSVGVQSLAQLIITRGNGGVELSTSVRH